MNRAELKEAQAAAVHAARTVGAVMRRHLPRPKRANEATQHDIKLELDVRCQKIIERTLQSAFPNIALLGEEGVAGERDSPFRWVVDPIDGTVNFAYGIPHACVSIALQERVTRPKAADYADGYTSLAAVVYDPFNDELWTAMRGHGTRLNGKLVHVGTRSRLDEAIVSIGFAKSRENLEATLPYFNELVPQVRKIRIMGAAALALAYVATGRFDAYIERGIRIWDIAAGGLLVESAGGEFWHQAASGEHVYRMIATNAHLRKRLRVPE